MKNLNRRNFLYTSGKIAAGAILIPNLLHCRQGSPNSTVNLAIVGVGGRGSNNWMGMITNSYNEETKERELNPNVRIVALCDVNDDAAASSYKLLPGVPIFKDFRVMFDKMHKDIDAVVVSTPDHTHFAVTMAAMQLGKHVYVEKPLAHNVWQLRTLVKAAKHYGVINQLGNQGHASNSIRDVKEWYDQGILGEVKEVHAWFQGPEFNKPGDFSRGYFIKPDNYPAKGQQVPEGLDWDLWLGPTSERAYSPYYLPRFWRSWYELGNALLGDWACHTMDAPFWALDLGSPTVVEQEHAILSESPMDFLPDESILRFEFPQRGNKAPVTLHWYEGGQKPEPKPEWNIDKIGKSGMIMVGDKNIALTGGRPNGAKLVMPDEEWNTFKDGGWEKTIPRVPEENQYKEFIKAIRGDGPMPGSNFEYGAALTEMALLGVLSQRFNTRIEFDTKNMKVTNHLEINNYIKEEVRPGWSYGEDLW